MGLPTAQDVMEFLRGYCLDTLSVDHSETVTANNTTNVINITGGYAYATGDMVKFTSTGSVPSPLVASTVYYLVAVDSTHVKVATTRDNADAGMTVDLTSDGSGTITMSQYDYPYANQDWIEKRRDRFIVPHIERITRQSFSARTQVTELYSGNGKNVLFLSRRPIYSLDEIRYILGGSNLTILNLNNIQVDTARGILKAKRSYEESYYLPVFAKGEENLQVTYTYGYASVPEDVKEAMIYLMAEQLLGVIGARTGGGSLSVQGFSRNYGERGKWQDVRNDLARQANSLLAKYSTHVVGS